MKQATAKFRIFLVLLGGILLSSCSDNDYVNAIPSDSMALISMDMGATAHAKTSKILTYLLHASNQNKSGIDITSKLYMFETGDGILGLCAKVSDEDDLTSIFEKLSSQGACDKLRKRKGFRFTTLHGSWAIGYSDAALLVMGPTTPAASAELQSRMAKYLELDEEKGIAATPMFDKLDSIQAPMALVTQIQALPEQFAAPFTLGAPKDADPSQVLLAAQMSTDEGCLLINGATFSFVKSIDKVLKESQKVLRPIKGTYASVMPNNALLGLFVNVDGEKFLPVMQQNKGIQALLAGINTAIDMDNILRSVDGDMAIVSPSFDTGNLQLSMGAQLAHSKWLADVDYWKKSVPQGGKISDWKQNAYYYGDGKTSFYFGVTPSLQFYAGSSADEALATLKPAASPLAAKVTDGIQGSRMVLVVNLAGLHNDKVQAISGMLNPLFGNIHTIVYTLK